jgi:hypothetical protein
MGLSKNPIMPSADKFPHCTIMPLADKFPHHSIVSLADKSDKRVPPQGSFIFAIKKERLSFGTASLFLQGFLPD